MKKLKSHEDVDNCSDSSSLKHVYLPYHSIIFHIILTLDHLHNIFFEYRYWQLVLGIDNKCI